MIMNSSSKNVIIENNKATVVDQNFKTIWEIVINKNDKYILIKNLLTMKNLYNHFNEGSLFLYNSLNLYFHFL